MLILETSACSEASVLATILFIKKLTKILSIIVPAILIVLLSIDIGKAVIASDDNDIKRAQKLALKRLIYGAIVFFVPMIVDTAFNLLDGEGLTSCYNNATDEVVSALQADKKEKLLASEQEKKEMIEEIKKNGESYKQYINELRKNKENEQQSSGGNSNAAAGGIYQKGLSGAEAIAQTAEALAWPLGTKTSVYKHNYQYNRKWKSWSELTKAKPTKAFMDAYDQVKPNHFQIPSSPKWGTKHTRIGASCDKFAGTVVRYSGYDKSFPDSLGANQNKRLANKDKWQKVSGKNAKRGAVCIKKAGTHILIYVGNGVVAHAGYGGVGKNSGTFGRLQKYNLGSSYNCWNPTK